MILKEETTPNEVSNFLGTTLQCFDEVFNKSFWIPIANVLWDPIESVANGDQNRDMLALKGEIIGWLLCARFVLKTLEIEHDGVRKGDSLFLWNAVISPWFWFVLPSNHEVITAVSYSRLVVKSPLEGHFARYCVSLVILINSFIPLFLSRKASLTIMPVTATKLKDGL